MDLRADGTLELVDYAWLERTLHNLCRKHGHRISVSLYVSCRTWARLATSVEATRGIITRQFPCTDLVYNFGMCRVPIIVDSTLTNWRITIA